MAKTAQTEGQHLFTCVVPIHVQVRVGLPITVSTAAPVSLATAELDAAKRELAEAQNRPYYDAAADEAARANYYPTNLATLSSVALFDKLSDLLRSTHAHSLSYKPATRLYPWVDLQANLKIRSIYSTQEFDPLELIQADIEAARRIDEAMAAFRRTESAMTEGAEAAYLEGLEAQNPYNCEHVVPQSWFLKKQPMRGDLHHLFGCEVRCNSFRGNIPYFDFDPADERTMQQCGRNESNKFEPLGGKGAVARATLYWILRYRNQINKQGQKYDGGRLDMLLNWHMNHPVDTYERHRNQAIFAVQGNRNPLIDFPQLASKIDFSVGL